VPARMIKRLLRKTEKKQRKNKVKASHVSEKEVRKDINSILPQLKKARTDLVDLGKFPMKGELRERLEYMERALPRLRRWRNLDDRMNRLKDKLKKMSQ
jgi:hypothetical protein